MSKSTMYEYRVRWKPDVRPSASCARTATFQTLKGARRHYEKIGPEPWKVWGCGPDDEFHASGCTGGEDGYCDDGCPGTWRRAFADRKAPIYREIVRRPVGEWEPIEREEGAADHVCRCGRINPDYVFRMFDDKRPHCEECGGDVPASGAEVAS